MVSGDDRLWDRGAVQELVLALLSGRVRWSDAREAVTALAAIDKRRRPGLPVDAIDFAEWLKGLERPGPGGGTA